jgi:hypothetical protein
MLAKHQTWFAVSGKERILSSAALRIQDQLQDVLSLLHAKTEPCQEQILLCASRQLKKEMCSIGGTRPKDVGFELPVPMITLVTLRRIKVYIRYR